MSDARPAKAELQRKVEALRARVAELEQAAAERTRAEEAFEASQAAFAAVFHSAPVMMWLLDRDRRVLESNRAAQEVAARSGPEMRRLAFGDAVRCVNALASPAGCGFGPSCEACPLRRVVFDTFETGRSHHQVEAKLTLRHADELRDSHYLVSTSLPDAPNHSRLLVCVQDVTDSRRAADALRQTHELLERVFAATHVCIAYMDTHFNFIRVNRAYAEADERTPESLVGKNHFDLYPNEENDLVFRRVLETGEPCSFYGRPFEYLEHPERGMTYWDWSLHPIKDAAGAVAGVLLCLVDVTKRERAERLARERQAALADVSRVSIIGEMASGLAHELGQPLGAICTYAEACRNMIGSGDVTELADTVDKIAGQAQRAAQIVRHIRGFVRRAAPDRSTFNVNDLIRETVRLVEVEAKTDGIAVSVELPDRSLPVQADPIEIQQVLVNLVRNGFDAIRQAAAGPRAMTIRSSADREGVVAIGVSDTGVGQGSNLPERMFEPFFTTKPGGIGLGLSISRSIIEAHGGRLWATPNPERGTTFRFTIPASGGADRARA